MFWRWLLEDRSAEPSATEVSSRGFLRQTDAFKALSVANVLALRPHFAQTNFQTISQNLWEVGLCGLASVSISTGSGLSKSLSSGH